MKNTESIIKQYNKELFSKLFPDNKEPILCNSVLNPNDEIYNLSFAEIAKSHLDEILKEQEFDLELEQIKNNLNII
jgi:hypothetical protein